jgi:hypothetical protein
VWGVDLGSRENFFFFGEGGSWGSAMDDDALQGRDSTAESHSSRHIYVHRSRFPRFLG